jgi:hypothetical protein
MRFVEVQKVYDQKYEGYAHGHSVEDHQNCLSKNERTIKIILQSLIIYLDWITCPKRIPLNGPGPKTAVISETMINATA